MLEGILRQLNTRVLMPDQVCVGRKSDKPIVTPSLSDGYTFLESLSEKDKPWDKHRKHADIISNYYKQGGMDSHAERVSLCSQLLEFKIVPAKQGVRPFLDGRQEKC